MLLVVIVFGAFTLPVAYAHFDELKDGKTLTITTEDGKEFEIGQDFHTEEDGQVIAKDPDAKSAKNLRFERGEDIEVELESAIFDTVTVCLVDKDTSDNSIGEREGSPCDIKLEEINCLDIGGPKPEECKGEFEVEVPDDIDKGKYKLVIRDADFDDEEFDVYINKVRIK